MGATGPEPPPDAVWYIRRIFPYRANENHIDGVVITFVEITERKRAEEAIRVQRGTGTARRRSHDRTPGPGERSRHAGRSDLPADGRRADHERQSGMAWTAHHLRQRGPVPDHGIQPRRIDRSDATRIARQTDRPGNNEAGQTRALRGKFDELRNGQLSQRRFHVRGRTAHHAAIRLGRSAKNFVSIHRDISERKNHEQSLLDRKARLRAIVDTAVDAIITIDPDGIIESFNPAAERMFGYSATEATGHNVKILMPAPYHEKHDGYIARYLKTGEKKIIGIGREVVGRRKDGTTFPVDLAVSEFEIGTKRHFTGIVRDISRQRADQQRLLQAERLAAIGEAMTGLTHESRNALSRSQANLRRLARRLKDQPQLLELIEGAWWPKMTSGACSTRFDNTPRPEIAVRRKDVGQLVRDAWEQLALARESRAAGWRKRCPCRNSPARWMSLQSGRCF